MIAGDAFQTFFEGGRGKPSFFMSASEPIKNALRAAQSVTSTFDRLVTAGRRRSKRLFPLAVGPPAGALQDFTKTAAPAKLGPDQ